MYNRSNGEIRLRERNLIAMSTRILHPAVDIERLAFNKLITILSATSVFAPYAGARDRYDLCQRAGILGQLGALDWTASAAQVAGLVIDRLNNYGSDSLPGRPGFTALGALADHLLDLPEVPPGDQAWLAGLVVQYELVTDQGYLNALAQKHGVVVQTAGAAAGGGGVAAQPVTMTSAARLDLAKALLLCPSMADRQNRDAIVHDLPAVIQLGISRSNTPLLDVRNIVDGCLNYEGGLGLLIEGVRLYEGDSRPMREVDRLVR